MTAIAAALAPYPEMLRWSHLQKIMGVSRRTIERRRAANKLPGVIFIDQFKTGSLQAVKSTLIQFLENRQKATEKDTTPPSLAAIRR